MSSSPTGTTTFGRDKLTRVSRFVLWLVSFLETCFGESPAAFISDEKALAVTHHAFRQRFDVIPSLADAHRQFLYMSLMYSDQLSDQRWCINLIEMRTENDNALDFINCTFWPISASQ